MTQSKPSPKIASKENKDQSWPQLRIGISSCLLGNPVRHNGGHKANEWLLSQLGPFVFWVPICPEVAMGLGVPRETLRLVGKATDPHLVTVKTREDLTDRALKTYEGILKKDLQIDAFIFKKDSPTCGLERVKVYGTSGIPSKNGIGLFAQAVLEAYPNIPMIEEGRLSDPKQREAFLRQLYLLSTFSRVSKKISAIQAFHQNHKLQLMVYDPSRYSQLGRIAANSKNNPVSQVFMEYRDLLSVLVKKPLTAQKYINAFQHILGYFKTNLQENEKAKILELLESYRMNQIPFLSVSTLFNYLAEKYSIEYLKGQSIFRPYPEQIIVSDP